MNNLGMNQKEGKEKTNYLLNLASEKEAIIEMQEELDFEESIETEILAAEIAEKKRPKPSFKEAIEEARRKYNLMHGRVV